MRQASFQTSPFAHIFSLTAFNIFSPPIPSEARSSTPLGAAESWLRRRRHRLQRSANFPVRRQRGRIRHSTPILETQTRCYLSCIISEMVPQLEHVKACWKPGGQLDLDLFECFWPGWGFYLVFVQVGPWLRGLPASKSQVVWAPHHAKCCCSCGRPIMPFTCRKVPFTKSAPGQDFGYYVDEPNIDGIHGCLSPKS